MMITLYHHLPASYADQNMLNAVTKAAVDSNFILTGTRTITDEQEIHRPYIYPGDTLAYPANGWIRYTFEYCGTDSLQQLVQCAKLLGEHLRQATLAWEGSIR